MCFFFRTKPNPLLKLCYGLLVLGQLVWNVEYVNLFYRSLHLNYIFLDIENPSYNLSLNFSFKELFTGRTPIKSLKLMPFLKTLNENLLKNCRRFGIETLIRCCHETLDTFIANQKLFNPFISFSFLFIMTEIYYERKWCSRKKRYSANNYTLHNIQHPQNVCISYFYLFFFFWRKRAPLYRFINNQKYILLSKI